MALSALANRFRRMMGTVVTVEPSIGVTGQNQHLYGTPRYYRAYVNATGVLFRDAQGQEVVSAAVVSLHPLEVNADGTPKVGAVPLLALPQTSRISWPDASVPGGTAQPVILRANGITDFRGDLVLWEVYT